MTDTNRVYSAPPALHAWRWGLVAALVLAAALLAIATMPAAGETANGAPSGAANESQAAGEGETARAILEIGDGVPTVAQLFMTSPYINTTLLTLSILALGLFVYLAVTITSASLSPPRFIDDVTRLVLGKQFDNAVHLCQSHSSIFVASPIQRVVENRDKPHGVIIDILHAEGRRRGEVVWNRIGYLSEISNIAPMIGLLGTLIGMIKVFFSLTMQPTGETAAGLSEGIAEAMSTTMFGLGVAILAGVFYTIIRSRAVRVLSETEQICHTLADHTVRAAADPRIQRIDALADAAKRKVKRSGSSDEGPSSVSATSAEALADAAESPDR